MTPNFQLFLNTKKATGFLLKNILCYYPIKASLSNFFYTSAQKKLDGKRFKQTTSIWFDKNNDK